MRSRKPRVELASRPVFRDSAPMLAFWPDVIHPILRALTPATIVEIGSEEGKTTRLLAEFAHSSHAHLTAIDPAPRFDVKAWTSKYQDHFTMLALPSLVALPSIRQFDVILIDGDHNWYTVYNELLLIESLSKQIGQPLPLVLLHDIGWPYARRDLYYDPATIPEEYRHPFQRRGISPTSSELVVQGGFNRSLNNACHEGGPKNGVRTAIEDYLAQTAEKIAFVRIPAVFGLGILLPNALAQAKPQVANLINAWASPTVEQFIERLELARIAMLTGIAR